MDSWTDQQLLREYSDSRAEPAFAELVRRHIDLVHSAALRMVGDVQLAEDITQAVFIALAQNARKLVNRLVLSGWLHRTARNLAAKTVRQDIRRRARETLAVAMNEMNSTDPNVLWEHVASRVDQLMNELSESDRDVVLLRFFQRKSAHEIGRTLGLSDE